MKEGKNTIIGKREDKEEKLQQKRQKKKKNLKENYVTLAGDAEGMTHSVVL